MLSQAPARGARYLALLNKFVAEGEVIACEPRYAVVRREMLVSQGISDQTNVYLYGIGCFMCGAISWNPTDVKAHYCAACEMFHDNA